MVFGGLGGLGAVAGGYNTGEHDWQANRLGKAKADDAELEQLGMAAAGRAIQMFNAPMPGAMPLVPGPGQASVPGGGGQPPPMAGNPPPMPPQMAGGAAPMGGGGQQPGPLQMGPLGPPQGGMNGPGGMDQGGPQPGGMGPQGGSLNWRTVAQMVVHANPQAPPQVIARAVDKFFPAMTLQSQMDWKMQRLELMGAQLAERSQHNEAVENIRTSHEAELARKNQEVEQLRREAETGRNARGAAVEEGRAQREEGRNTRAQLSNETKLQMSTLSNKTRAEIADQIDKGKTARAELSTDARREIAGMNIDAQRELKTMIEEGRNERFATGEKNKTERAGAAEEGRQKRADTAETGRNQRFDTNQARLNASTAIRQDQRAEQLRLQREELERKITQGGDRALLGQWRAALDAEHKRATEIIGAHSDNVNLKPDERKKLLDQQNQTYTNMIQQMKAQMEGGSNFKDRFGASSNQNTPPISALKEGHVTTFQNGQKWTLENGQPKQVP